MSAAAGVRALFYLTCIDEVRDDGVTIARVVVTGENGPLTVRRVEGSARFVAAAAALVALRALRFSDAFDLLGQLHDAGIIRFDIGAAPQRRSEPHLQLIQGGAEHAGKVET